MSTAKHKHREPLACGCEWTPAKPLRCGICDRCGDHCKCDKKMSVKRAEQIITIRLEMEGKKTNRDTLTCQHCQHEIYADTGEPLYP